MALVLEFSNLANIFICSNNVTFSKRENVRVRKKRYLCRCKVKHRSRVRRRRRYDVIDARYGSLDNFLEKELDLTADEKQILQNKFLENR